MIRSLQALALAALVACLGAPGALAGEGLRLTEAGQASFPQRSFLLGAPAGATFAPGQIDVRENGRRVSGLEAVSARTGGGKQLGIVLVIDKSGSMRGRAIGAATRAARALASHRNPQQPLAIVTFDRTPSVVLPFTTDERRIQRALSAPPKLGPGTRIYDALSEAVALIERGGVAVGSIVLLSDGDDSGSRVTEKSAAAMARAVGVRVFTVGLESSSLDPAALRRLATQAHGQYFRARGPDDLTPIYDELGTQLSSEYLLRYRSKAGPGLQALVEARVKGVPGVARTTYLTPVRPQRPGKPYQDAYRDGFWGSTLALVLVSLLCALPLAFVTVVLARRRTGNLRARLEAFISSPSDGVDVAPDLQGEVLSGAEKSLANRAWWNRLREDLEIARIEKSAIQVLTQTVLATAAAVFLLTAISGSLLVGFVGFAVPFAVRAVIQRKLSEQRKLFGEQLGENCEVLASAMRAGHSLVGALSVVVDEAAEPSKTEFGRVVADERFGVPLEAALAKVGRRMESKDLPQVAIVAALQRDTGGSTAEVLDRVAEGIRARLALRRTVATLTAQGRAARWVLTFLPFGLMVAITVVAPGYLDPLYKTGSGHVLIVIALIMVTAGSLAIKRIVDIKV